MTKTIVYTVQWRRQISRWNDTGGLYEIFKTEKLAKKFCDECQAKNDFNHYYVSRWTVREEEPIILCEKCGKSKNIDMKRSKESGVNYCHDCWIEQGYRNP